jgi:hypothetical protein
MLCLATQIPFRDIHECLKKNMVRWQWRKADLLKIRFRDGHVIVNDYLHCGRPASTNDEKMERVLNVERSERRKNLQETSAEIGISVGSIHRFLHKNVNMNHFCRHLVTKIPTPGHKHTQKTNNSCYILVMADQSGNCLARWSLQIKLILYDPQPKSESVDRKSKSSSGAPPGQERMQGYVGGFLWS